MPMTVVVTRDVAARFRGFLASCMLEIEPGVYTAPDMSAAVRGRALRVLQEWFGELGGGSIIMVWRDRQTVSGQGLVILGAPPMDLVDHEGLILVRRAVANPPPPPSS